MPTEHSSPEAPFPEHWVDGLDPNEPALQVHRHAEGTWIMRQSLLDHWEGPFMYLFAGEERAILFDTGAPGKFPLRETVDDLVGKDFPSHRRPHPFSFRPYCRRLAVRGSGEHQDSRAHA